MTKTKALVLFSGGLDSMLAARLLKEQGLAVELLCFTSIFFSGQAAQKAAAELALPLRTHDMSGELLALVKNPPNGYGKHLNPCIDCHALMIKKAGEIIRENGYDLVATGEVLGQRPFSQNKAALAKIGRLAGADILRPLSAKLLPPTAAEESGLVKRHKLFDISGRSRERQLALAKAYGLKNYATPAGGCLLTDPEYSARLLKLLLYWPECGVNDAECLRQGRVFWLAKAGPAGAKALLVVGRDEGENGRLNQLAKKGDFMLELIEIAGPTALLRGLAENPEKKGKISLTAPKRLKMSSLGLDREKSAAEIIDVAALLAAFYAVKARGKGVQVACNFLS